MVTNLSERSLSELVVRRLREADLRPTPQRIAIYKALAADKSHPTAMQLYESVAAIMPTLSQATVYNTLQLLVEQGIVQELGDAGDGAVHYDADIRPHVNLICTSCHKIEDFDGAVIAHVSAHVARDSGYVVKGARVAYYGLCPSCAANN